MTDIKHDETGDIDLNSGDFLYITSDYQHQKDILLTRKGYYKEHPETGVGIRDYINETDPEELLRSVRQEFASDGMKVNKVTMTATGQLETDASYENR